MRKTTYKEFNRYTCDTKKIFKTYYYFSTKEGYEYQKDGIRFYIRKDDDEWNISVELGFRVHRCNSYKEVIDFLNHWIFRMFYCQLWKKGKNSSNHIEMKSLMKKWF
nr:MAG TPA: hypothetical protein [Caudoviricetes sp.]